MLETGSLERFESMSTFREPFQSEDNSNSNLPEIGEAEHPEEVTAVPPSEQPLEEAGVEEQADVSAPSAESSLPPEAQWEANGGPLGCCLGVVAGLFFSIFVGVIGFGHNFAFLLAFVLPFDALTDIRVATGCIAILGTVIFGYVGWKIGKRFYREYEPSILKDRRRKSKSNA